MALTKNMFVRCPIIDMQYPLDPRDFIMGKIKDIDEFADTADVIFEDPFNYRAFYPNIPKQSKYHLSMIMHCELYKGSRVVYKNNSCHVIKCVRIKGKPFEYYIQNDENKNIILVKEDEISAGFINGWISPKQQLKRYEFQNPSWYLGRCVVNRANKVLDNSILGFKELAGCKIFLMPHQITTIMRCFQEQPCRYMLADEVGMGKTIEAAAVLKLYLTRNSKKNVLIVVPKALKEQWKVELFLKFGLDIGRNINSNNIYLKTIEELTDSDLKIKWDFVINDESHRLLQSPQDYEKFYKISKNTNNLLLLSATPLQNKSDDYLRLLRILDPTKYDNVSENEFSRLVKLQKQLVDAVVLIQGDIENIKEDIDELEGEDPHNDDECKELFSDIYDGLEEITDLIDDSTYEELVELISFDKDDLGLQEIQIAISYICDNYQLERHIIRNRRGILPKNDMTGKAYSERHLYKEVVYQNNSTEYMVYQRLIDLIENDVDKGIDDITNYYRPLLGAFFSTASAFYEELKNTKKAIFNEDDEINRIAYQWKLEEEDRIDHLDEVLEDPDRCNDRISKIIDYLDQDLYEEKVILFTSYTTSFWVFKRAIEKIFDSSEVCYFCKDMAPDELELNVYRFQNDRNCRIMLCDKSGGEGRNFQNADFIIHIDLPWDANEIEQRIGRLDRLERDPNRPDVNSVVVYSEDTFEQQLFNFWNDGLNVFKEPLSGLEIILEEINRRIFESIITDFQYGLASKVQEFIDRTKKLKSDLRKEQTYDILKYLYQPMNSQLHKLITYYNQNENELFSRTMMGWASLAGFNPRGEGKIVEFNEKAFSIRSAENTLLIPPNWTVYLQEKRTAFTNRIQELYSGVNVKQNVDTSKIKGTFDRKTAIDNDYLHFFAPGDDIFDCIIDNAIRSTKGQCTAFFLKGSINWIGFIYSFSAEVNENILIRNGISPIEIAYFRNFLSSNIVDIPVALENYSDIDPKIVLSEYNDAMELGYKSTQTIVDHLGRRGKSTSGFMRIPMRYNVSNLEWFKSRYPEDKWTDMVDNSYKYAKEKAIGIISKQSHLKNAKEEMIRNISARIASSKFYGNGEINQEKLQKKYSIIFECLKNPQIRLESASFIWMVKSE